LKIITTHLSADFDAFASAVAAQRLFPGHRVLFPGSLEATVRRFRREVPLEINEIRMKEVRKQRITEAVILDTPDRARLGEAWDLITREHCSITRIDHHSRGDLPITDHDVVRPVGSTSTLITELYQQRELHPTPEEASLLLLGIYEDTGRLSFRETTPADFRAAAWLLEVGGDLRWVRRWISRNLDPAQLQLLQQLIAGAEEDIIASIPVVISTVEISEYPEEAAAAIHQWIEAFHLPVVAVMLVRDGTIRVILRSRTESVDVGSMARELGGGGHATAASATLRNRSPVEVREDLRKLFRRQLPAPLRAGDAALRRIFHLDRRCSVAEAATKLNEWRINAVPVSDDGEFCGTVTRQILDRSLAMGLGERPLEVIMQPGVLSVDAEQSLEEIREIFMEGSRRFVIVRENGRAIGILTRMEVFRRLHEALPRAGAALDHRMAASRPLRQNIGRKLREALPEWVRPVLEAVKELSPEGNPPVYLVGGAVRDLLLEREIDDVDLVVEGDGILLAEGLASMLGGRVHTHRPFMTAVLTLPDGHSVDVASARTEFYTAPAALPSVETSLIRQDLYRRDFTINALAVSISGPEAGMITDYFGGRKDLDAGIIRVLHSLSFIDDPTRAIRAVRYARRLDFHIAPDTRHLIGIAAREGVFDRLSAHRLRHELELLLNEAHPAGGLALLQELSLLDLIIPGIRWKSDSEKLLLEVEAQLAWYLLEDLVPRPDRLILFPGAAIIAAGDSLEHSTATCRDLVGRLQLTGRRARSLEALPAHVHTIRQAARHRQKPSETIADITDAGPEALLLAMALLPMEERRLLAERAEKGCALVMPLRGRDLIEAGLRESPGIGSILEATRRAILDGDIQPTDALEFALHLAEEAS